MSVKQAKPQELVLTPTRELAPKMSEVLRSPVSAVRHGSVVITGRMAHVKEMTSI